MLTSHDLNDLRRRAAPVTDDQPEQTLGPRGVARALSGIVRLVANQYGHRRMREACANLALLRVSWKDWARIDPASQTMVAVAEGLVAVSSYEDARAALAFWACETDPAVWRDVAAAA